MLCPCFLPMLHLSGDECNKAGVGFTAFRYHPEKCSRRKYTCLDYQLAHRWGWESAGGVGADCLAGVDGTGWTAAAANWHKRDAVMVSNMRTCCVVRVPP